MHLPRLIFASQSRYKQSQLASLMLDFTSIQPDMEENHENQSDIKALAIDLARQKAQIIAERHPESCVIGSDQTAELADGTLLTKPGSHARAVAQLLQSSGQKARFYSAVCLLSAAQTQAWAVTTELQFRSLSADEIERYLRFDQPYDCAGSFKVESAGISLFDYVRSDDPSALIGLPLISLAGALRAMGYTVP